MEAAVIADLGEASGTLTMTKTQEVNATYTAAGTAIVTSILEAAHTVEDVGTVEVSSITVGTTVETGSYI